MLLLALVLGCSKSENPPAPQPPRGEPIRGEPIRSAVQTTNGATPEPVKTNAVAATAKPAESASKTPPVDPNFTLVGFDKLASYTFSVPEGIIANEQVGKSEEQIPAEVKALNQKKVALRGFMLPLKVDNGLVTEMLVMKDQSMCCYGAVPRINDWVSVKMKNGGVKSVMDQPVRLYGKLRVGEMLENGYLVGIYEMDGEKMDEPND